MHHLYDALEPVTLAIIVCFAPASTVAVIDGRPLPSCHADSPLSAVLVAFAWFLISFFIIMGTPFFFNPLLSLVDHQSLTVRTPSQWTRTAPFIHPAGTVKRHNRCMSYVEMHWWNFKPVSSRKPSRSSARGVPLPTDSAMRSLARWEQNGNGPHPPSPQTR